MHRSVVLLALVACEAPSTPAGAPRAWVYPEVPLAWPLGAVTGRIGRSQAPQRVASAGISGDPTSPLHLPTVWAVPGDGPARAIVYGQDRDRPAIELVDVDRGRVVWRDAAGCAAPVVGVTAEVVVCADAQGVRAVALDGKPRWRIAATFIAITDDRVITAGAGESIILDAQTGNEIARVKLPEGVTSDSILASCGDAGRELFAVGRDGKLVRVAEAQGGPKVAWSVGIGTEAGIDACSGATVLITASSEEGTALIAVARDTGKITGRVDGVRGYWPARDGSRRLEVSTATGVAIWPGDLASPPEPPMLPALGELLGKRGDRRLVRATPLTAALLDRAGVRAYLPLAALGAVLGDDHVVAASWLGSPGETVHRIALPAAWNRRLRVPARRAPVAVPAELRDLPAIVDLEGAGAIARPGIAAGSVAAIALDPDGQGLYALTLEHEPDDATGAGVARFELATRAWSWGRGDGCGPGSPVAVAATRELVACAARGAKGASVRVTARDGTPRWSWTGDNVDAIEAAAGMVVVHDADRLLVLDAGDGHPLGWFASDDGGALRAAAIDVAGASLLVTYERGRVVGRVPAANLVPAWSFEVAGVVRALAPAGAGVLVELEDGDAFRIDARTAEATALPGLGLVWRAMGELVTGQAAGGPVPPEQMPSPPGSTLPARPRPRDLDVPPIATPWPPPPPMPDSWQLTLYELAGGLRARNDYALAPPVAPQLARGPGDSPLVVEYGPGMREVLVIDPRRGDPLRRVRLPDAAGSGLAFATIVDGKPVVGTVLANPLRVVLF